MGQSHKILLLAAFGSTFLVAGCGNYETTLSDRYVYTPVIAPKMSGSDPLQAPLRHTPYSSDLDSINRDRDPYLTQPNPMLSQSSTQSDPMQSQAGHTEGDSTDPTQRPTYGRYYLDGDITSGEVEIAVNGTPIGTYSSHIDQEVTQYCHNGQNMVTFTHHPTMGASPMSSVHIQLFNREKPSDPIAFTYDTVSAASQMNDAAQSAPSDDSSTTPSIPKPSLPTPGSPSLSDNANNPDIGFTDSRSFDDNEQSYQPPPGAK